MKSRLIPACLILVLLQGCYLLNQGKGQLDLRFSQIPLQEAQEQEADPEFRRLFNEIPRIKAFAVKRLLLEKSDNYTAYYKTDRRGVTYVVTASFRDRLEPHTWWFPILGSVPYKGYFNQKEADEEARELQQEGYDTWIFAAPAYSTLGWFKDPVTTPMMRRGHYYLANTIIHEMTHETLFVPGAVEFNEQLATFVGEKGALQYFEEVLGLDNEQMDRLKERIRRSGEFSRSIRRYLPRFEELYGRKLPLEEILLLRDGLFHELEAEIGRRFPTVPKERRRFNNARLLQFRRYAPDSTVLEIMWEKSGHDWPRFWQQVRDYADDINKENDQEERKLVRVVENICDKE